MNKRNAVRYGAEYLSAGMSKVMISWEESAPVEAVVVDCSAHGLKIIIPALQTRSEVPHKNNTVMVRMPNDKTWLTGMCVFTTKELDDLVTMGIYFYNPHEQNYLQDMLYSSLACTPQVTSFVSHEWEEFVEKLCNSDDPQLKQKGLAKRNSILAKQKASASEMCA